MSTGHNALTNALKSLNQAKIELQNIKSPPIASEFGDADNDPEFTSRQLEVNQFFLDMKQTTANVENRVKDMMAAHDVDLRSKYGLTDDSCLNTPLGGGDQSKDERKMRKEALLALEYYMGNFKTRRIGMQLDSTNEWFNERLKEITKEKEESMRERIHNIKMPIQNKLKRMKSERGSSSLESPNNSNTGSTNRNAKSSRSKLSPTSNPKSNRLETENNNNYNSGRRSSAGTPLSQYLNNSHPDWDIIESELHTVGSTKEESDAMFTSLIQKIHDAEEKWEIEIKRAVASEKRRLASKVVDLSYEVKAKESEFAFLQTSSNELDSRIRHAGTDETEIRNQVESHFERFRLSLLATVQKQKDMKFELTLKKQSDEKEERTLDNLLKELRNDRGADPAQKRQTALNVLTKLEASDRTARIENEDCILDKTDMLRDLEISNDELRERISLTQQQDKTLSMSIERTKVELAQETASLRHQIRNLHDKSDDLSVKIQSLEATLMEENKLKALKDHLEHNQIEHELKLHIENNLPMVNKPATNSNKNERNKRKKRKLNKGSNIDSNSNLLSQIKQKKQKRRYSSDFSDDMSIERVNVNRKKKQPSISPSLLSAAETKAAIAPLIFKRNLLFSNNNNNNNSDSRDGSSSDEGYSHEPSRRGSVVGDWGDWSPEGSDEEKETRRENIDTINSALYKIDSKNNDIHPTAVAIPKKGKGGGAMHAIINSYKHQIGSSSTNIPEKIWPNPGARPSTPDRTISQSTTSSHGKLRGEEEGSASPDSSDEDSDDQDYEIPRSGIFEGCFALLMKFDDVPVIPTLTASDNTTNILPALGAATATTSPIVEPVVATEKVPVETSNTPTIPESISLDPVVSKMTDSSLVLDDTQEGDSNGGVEKGNSNQSLNESVDPIITLKARNRDLNADVLVDVIQQACAQLVQLECVKSKKVQQRQQLLVTDFTTEDFEESLRQLRAALPVLPVDEMKTSLRMICISMTRHALLFSAPALLAKNKLIVFSQVLMNLFGVLETALFCSPPRPLLPRSGFEIDIFMEELSEGLIQHLFGYGAGYTQKIHPERLFGFLRTRVHMLFQYLRSGSLRKLCRRLLVAATEYSQEREEINRQKENEEPFKWSHQRPPKSPPLKSKLFVETVFSLKERNLLFGFQSLFMLASHPHSSKEGRELCRVIIEGLGKKESITDYCITPGDDLENLLSGCVSVSALPALITLDLLRRMIDCDLSRFQIMSRVVNKDQDLWDLFFLVAGSETPDGSSHKGSWHDAAEKHLHAICLKVLLLLEKEATAFTGDKDIDDKIKTHIIELKAAAKLKNIAGKEKIQQLIRDFEATIRLMEVMKNRTTGVIRAFVRPFHEKLEWFRREYTKIAVERDKLLEKLSVIRSTVKFQKKEIVTVAAQLEAIAVGEITTIPADLEVKILRPGEDNGSLALKQAIKESEKLEKQLVAWKSEWAELYKQEKDLQEYLLAPGRMSRTSVGTKSSSMVISDLVVVGSKSGDEANKSKQRKGILSRSRLSDRDIESLSPTALLEEAEHLEKEQDEEIIVNSYEAILKALMKLHTDIMSLYQTKIDDELHMNLRIGKFSSSTGKQVDPRIEKNLTMPWIVDKIVLKKLIADPKYELMVNRKLRVMKRLQRKLEHIKRELIKAGKSIPEEEPPPPAPLDKIIIIPEKARAGTIAGGPTNIHQSANSNSDSRNPKLLVIGGWSHTDTTTLSTTNHSLSQGSTMTAPMLGVVSAPPGPTPSTMGSSAILHQYNQQSSQSIIEEEEQEDASGENSPNIPKKLFINYNYDEDIVDDDTAAENFRGRLKKLSLLLKKACGEPEDTDEQQPLFSDEEYSERRSTIYKSHSDIFKGRYLNPLSRLQKNSVATLGSMFQSANVEKYGMAEKVLTNKRDTERVEELVDQMKKIEAMASGSDLHDIPSVKPSFDKNYNPSFSSSYTMPKSPPPISSGGSMSRDEMVSPRIRRVRVTRA